MRLFKIQKIWIPGQFTHFKHQSPQQATLFFTWTSCLRAVALQQAGVCWFDRCTAQVWVAVDVPADASAPPLAALLYQQQPLSEHQGSVFGSQSLQAA